MRFLFNKNGDLDVASNQVLEASKSSRKRSSTFPIVHVEQTTKLDVGLRTFYAMLSFDDNSVIAGGTELIRDADRGQTLVPKGGRQRFQELVDIKVVGLSDQLPLVVIKVL